MVRLKTVQAAAAALAMAGGLLALTACGAGPGASSEAAADGGGDVVGDGPSIQVTVDVTGKATVKGSTTALPGTMAGISYDSCDQYAKGEDHDNGDKYLVLPKELGNRIDGKTIFVGVQVKGYHGPADYPGDQLTDVSPGPGIVIDGKTYYMDSDDIATVTVDGSGGGRWEFHDLSVQNDDQSISHGALTGSVSWTCKNS